MRKGLAATVVLVVGLLICPLMAGAANDLATINGRVRDSSGTPVVGALVIAVAASPIFPERIALTDKDGSFSILNLFAGQIIEQQKQNLIGYRRPERTEFISVERLRLQELFRQGNRGLTDILFDATE